MAFQTTWCLILGFAVILPLRTTARSQDFVPGYELYKGLGELCYKLYKPIAPYPVQDADLGFCKHYCDTMPQCGAFLMAKKHIEAGERGSCYMIEPNNLFNECPWREHEPYYAYKKGSSRNSRNGLSDLVPGYELYKGLGKWCYNLYKPIAPYPVPDADLEFCKHYCDKTPQCGAFLMAKKHIEAGEKAGCYMIEPNNLFNECPWSTADEPYYAYKKGSSRNGLSVQWSGIQTKIWGIDQCRNTGNFGHLNFGLEDCKKKCLEIATCTAINYNKVDRDCSTQGCTQPVPAPQIQYGDYRGYYIKVADSVPGYKLYEGLGEECYWLYKPIQPYPEPDVTLLECKKICDLTPHCGAFLMAKKYIEAGEKANCYMIVPMDLFTQCRWTDDGPYNAYEKELSG